MLHRLYSKGYLVNQLARLYIRTLDRKIEPLGLSHGQFPTLIMLWERPGMTQAEIARAVSVEQPTMANTLNRMERDGWIRRAKDPNDGRRTLLYPTDKAMAVRDEALAEARQLNVIAMQDFTPEEEDTVGKLLERMIHNMQNYLDEDEAEHPHG